MKYRQHLLLLLALLLSPAMWAQYDPYNPDEPGTQPWQLTLKSTPDDAGYFSLNEQSNHAAGEQFVLWAYEHYSYHFVRWEDAQGNILSTERYLNYTMPARHVTLVARYEYAPDNPDEPGPASIRRHLYLKTNPEGAGWFNFSSSNDITVDEVIHIWAYSSQNYQFLNWTQDGRVISTSSDFTYTMPDKDVTLVANYQFNYQPGNPDEPGQPQGDYYNIYGMRVGAMAGQTVSYPLYLENIGGSVTGFQVDFSTPKGFTADAHAATLTDRANGHSLKAEQTAEGAWRFTVSGAQAIEGVGGKVLQLPIFVPDTATIDNVFTISLANGIVFKADGGQEAVKVRSGSLQIQQAPDDIPDSPDYAVTDLQTTTSEVMPGGSISLSWQVRNEGSLAGRGGWTERIYLVAPDGRKVNIGSVNYETAELKQGAAVSRNATVLLSQLPGIDGKADLAVTIIPAISAGEYAGNLTNNTMQTQGQPITVGKSLVLTVPTTPQQEGDVSSVRCQLARSGNWTKAETFQLTKLTGDDRISMPQTVTIPREQAATYFYLPLNNDTECNADSIVSLRIEGNGYAAVEGTIVVRDDERPQLRLTASTTEVTEGETFQLTVQLDSPAEVPVPLYISAEQSHSFSIPTDILIPAGQSSLTVDIIAIDNNEIEPQQSILFRATSENYSEAECIILLNDNDMPELSFTLSPTDVSEADGQNAIFGIISRNDRLDSRITLHLSDNSNGLLTYESNTIVMESGMKNVQFQIGVEDNNQVDGNHTVTVTATVYSASCNCQMPDTGAGSLSATVTIIDDDGPSLNMKSSATAMKEGTQGNRFVISHNTPPDKDVLVTISSNRDDILEYNRLLTIPAGSTSAELLVGVKDNDTQDDSNIVTFKAEAEGYAIGTCWSLITDQTHPDAVVALRTDRETAEAGNTVGLTIVVTNLGNAPLNSRTPVKIVFSGRKSPVELTIGKRLAPGDSAVIDYNYDLPAITGIQTFETIVNSSASVEELIFTNNSSIKVPILILPPFDATAQVDQDRYYQGDSIVITGIANGEKGKNVNAEVYIINEGSRQSIPVTTDAEGHFTAIYHPLPLQVGHFTIGACYPGQMLNTEMDAFDVIGLVPQQQFSTCELGLTETYSGSIILSNPCAFRQNGITISQKGKSDNCDFHFSAPKYVDSGKRIEIAFTIKGNETTNGTQWQRMPIEITSEEGAHVNHTIYYYVQNPHAQLQVSTSNIETTMTLGTPREYPITLHNIGRMETGRITLSLPDWIETTTPRVMASLQQGDSTLLMLRFMPFDDMKLNIPVTGHFGINCENGNGISINFNITPVSETKGTLAIDVIDEYTYYTQQAPHVYDAKVRLMDPATLKVVAEGSTGFDGVYRAELPEGYYAVSVEADKHKNFEGHMLVNPGMNKNEEVFISYDAITYDWNIVETEVEDEYEIETVVKFETRVPKPVVTISLPRERPQPYSIIPITLTNHGLVHALDVSAWITTNDSYRIEPLNETWLDTLGAQQSYTIYAKLLPAQQEESAARPRKASYVSDCLSLGANSRNKQPCEKYPDYDYAHDEVSWGNCHGIGGGGGSGSGSGISHGGGPGNPGGGGTWSSISSSYSTSGDNSSDPARFCDQGPHSPDDYGPIDRNTMPKGLPTETDCNDPDPLNLIYHLVPTSGTPYIMEGVAADGISKVRIALDPSSRIPSSECNECHPTYWTLTAVDGEMEDLGKLTPNGWEATYTAPVDYPNNFGRVARVKATIHYECNNFPGSEDVLIEIIRPPVVLIHSQDDNGAECWKPLTLYLKYGIDSQPLYKKGMYQVVSYEGIDSTRFDSNSNVVYDAIFLAQKHALQEGYIATKCDLVGHSLGGLVARLFVERGGRKEDVNRIITVNTPHSGSELGDMMSAHNLAMVKAITKFFVGRDFAIWKDLGVESDVISTMVNLPGHFDIPVYALGTESIMYDGILFAGNDILLLVNNVLAFFDALSVAGAIAGDPLTKGACISLVATLTAAIIANDAQHVVQDDYTQMGQGDCIVSSDSQRGGCKTSEIIKNGPWHYNSIRNLDISKRIIELLCTKTSSSTFSKDWFKPTQRHFKHEKGTIWSFKSLSIVPILGSEISLVQNYSFKMDIILRHLPKNGGGLGVVSQEQERVLNIDLSLPDELTCVLASVYLNDQLVSLLTNEHPEYVIPSTFSGQVKVKLLMKDQEGNLYSDEQTETLSETLAQPVSLEAEELFLLTGKTGRVDLTCTWNDGTQSVVIPDGIEFHNNDVATYSNGMVKGISTGRTNATCSFQGLTCNTIVRVFPSSEISETDDDEDDSDAVCTTVTLSFKQKNVMTRQAFRGTLKVNNGNPETAMRDVKLHLEVRDPQGQLATTREFQINAESLEEFEGELALDAGWTLAAGATGTATILFIPTKYAAQTEPVDYSFGGYFSYVDPYTGLTVSRPLNPVTLTVNPSPNLDLTYFMQRDVYGDDPLTEEVEPVIPAEFALVMNNKGYGDATNMKLTTKQPEIIDNKKGLAISFEIVSSQLNGKEQNMTLGSSIANDFGTIGARSQAYAQWWLTSTLLGHFINYDVKANHVTSYGNEDLSLLDDVSIHELIHGFTPPAAQGRGFLVNDIADADDQPDEVYFSDGTQQTMNRATGATITHLGNNQYQLTINPSAPGWNYGAIADPTNGRFLLTSIIRLRDGVTLPTDNAWQTAVTLRDGKDPVHEWRLHFVCQTQGAAETWLLNFDEWHDLVKVEDAKGITEHGRIRISPLPLADHMYISGPFKDIRRVEIYDMRGMRRLSTNKVAMGQGIYTGSLPAGIYHVQVSTDQGLYSAKVIKR